MLDPTTVTKGMARLILSSISDDVANQPVAPGPVDMTGGEVAAMYRRQCIATHVASRPVIQPAQKAKMSISMTEGRNPYQLGPGTHLGMSSK